MRTKGGKEKNDSDNLRGGGVGYTVISLDRVILRASQESLAAAARALKYGCHTQIVRSSYSDKNATA